MDKILIKGLEFVACHGVMPEEKVIAQKFIIDLELHKDLTLAGQTDDLSNTINYVHIYEEVKDIVENNSFNLIEKMAEHIAQVILEKHLIEAIKVVVYKPNAPIKGRFDYFAVEIFRKSSENNL
ncbi:MAG TPA: dihydroneopterin aldolase [Syntrophomonadaceae bacterium]|nr:dihydroneopterin aldolase [Syntrophomonadaceae bacterium]